MKTNGDVFCDKLSRRQLRGSGRSRLDCNKGEPFFDRLASMPLVTISESVIGRHLLGEMFVIPTTSLDQRFYVGPEIGEER